jgi:type II secretory pathway component GspD/PulD (secretin)
LAAASGPARAEEVAEASDPVSDVPEHWLYLPRFLPAPALLEDAMRLGASPETVALDAGRGRLLLTATERDLPALVDVIDFLDTPAAQAHVRLAVVETLCTARAASGGHALFDRSAGDGPDTVFRGVRADFEPEDYLRSLLPGVAPFQGTDVRFGGEEGGAFDAALRGLLHRGEADLHACPHVLLTEGVPATIESTVELPGEVFVATRDSLTVQVAPREKAGVRLEALAERVGSDHVVLQVKAWLRQATATPADRGNPLHPTLVVREISARLTVGDGETVVAGGLSAFERSNVRQGLPTLARLPALEAVLAARERSSARTEIVFLVSASVRTPGRLPGAVPPGEPERLRLHAAPPKRPLDS